MDLDDLARDLDLGLVTWQLRKEVDVVLFHHNGRTVMVDTEKLEEGPSYCRRNLIARLRRRLDPSS